MVKSLAELVDEIKALGETDEVISLLENVTDSFNELEEKTEDSTDWKEKYEESERTWKKKYFDRFSGVKEEIKENDEEEEVDVEKKYTFDELFEEKED